MRVDKTQTAMTMKSVFKREHKTKYRVFFLDMKNQAQAWPLGDGEFYMDLFHIKKEGLALPHSLDRDFCSAFDAAAL